MNSLEAFEYVERHFDKSKLYLNLTLNNALEEIRADLQKLTEIEEKLGIDIRTFYKLIYADYVWLKYEDNEVEICSCLMVNEAISLIHKCIFDGSGEKFYFKDYGKTWALTSGELEKCVQD